MKLRKLLENITGYPQQQHDDHEVSMALTDLRSIAQRAQQLADHLEKEGITQLEGWVQSKITKSADYINAVYDEHMFGGQHQGCADCGHEREEEDDEEEDLDESKPNPLSTCCGRCGRFHVKGTTCRKPYLTGDKHCNRRPR